MNGQKHLPLAVVTGFAVLFSVMRPTAARAQVSFTSDVQPIFDAGCVNRGCHPGGGAPFSLQSTVSYMNLVNVPVSNPNCGATLRVTPFDSDASMLYLRISGQTPCSRMPLVGDTLSLIDQNTIRDWIDEGAMNDVTAVDGDEGSIPQKLSLHQNYPNPFNPATTIRFDLPRDAHVTLRLYDVLGNEVLTLVDGFRNAGNHVVTVEAHDLSSGIYICRITAGTLTQTVKMALLK